MKKDPQVWTVKQLAARFCEINFPEYQRESTVWFLASKQRLVDSMVRQFDIASIYLYEDENGAIDCIDGRQRIGAIMSFLGRNEDDEKDNGFSYRHMNEIYPETDPEFSELDGKTYRDIAELAARGSEVAQKMLRELDDFRITVVKLSGSSRAEEFSLQFTRLNLGVIINSGEKLHAMVGELKEACFSKQGLGQHPFLESTKIPTRRFAKEQVAAQIVGQVFSLCESDGFTSVRHFDLQRLLKQHTKLDDEQRSWIEEVGATLDDLLNVFDDISIFRNRAFTLSIVVLAWRVRRSGVRLTSRFAEFVGEFLCRLRWQVGKGIDADGEYRGLIEFQRHVTQASVEKSAIEKRAETLEGAYEMWRSEERIPGDREYLDRTGRDGSIDCRGEQRLF